MNRSPEYQYDGHEFESRRMMGIFTSSFLSDCKVPFIRSLMEDHLPLLMKEVKFLLLSCISVTTGLFSWYH